MAVRVAINGFGRTGRMALRAAHQTKCEDVEVVAINDLGPVATNAHLLKYDSVHGRFPGEVTTGDNWMDIGRGKIAVTAERDPVRLPWRNLGVDVVLECTGVFTKRAGAAQHLDAGAKRVIVSAPADGADMTIVMGVNHHELRPEHKVISSASCTTNCLAPVAYVLQQGIGIERGYMTTIHAYTGDQNIVDSLHKDLRRARAAALSLIPTSTGAAKAVGSRPAGAQRKARWHRDPGAYRECVADRLQTRRCPRYFARGGQYADGEGSGIEPAARHPRHQQVADGLGRLQS
jgi:glyceraldehyde 3-phosphate dehydrogenase